MATENIATVAEIQEATLNMLTATEFVKSTSFTLVDQYGDTRETLVGVIGDSKSKIDSDVDEVDSGKTSAISDIDDDVSEIESAKTDALAQISADLATVATEVNTINDSVTAAANSASSASSSASNAAISASTAQSVANFAGKWSLATGAKTIPISYWHNGNVWLLLQDVADITATEPTLSNSDWQMLINEQLPTPEVELFSGNSIIKTLSGALSFDRGSDATSISKSGVLESLTIDEPVIEKNGITIYGGVTNLLKYSEDFSDSTWIKAVDATVGTDGTLSPDLITESYYVDNTVDASGYIRQDVTLADSGEQITIQWFAKAGTSDEARVRWISLSGGTTQDYEATFSFSQESFISIETPVDKAEFKKMNDGWFLLSITATRNNTGNAGLRCYIAPSATDQGAIYAFGAQLSVASSVRPYVKTESTTAVKSPDNVTIPINSNMPVKSDVFTIIADFTYTEKVGFLFETESRGFGAYADGSGGVVIRGESALGSVASALAFGSKYRLVIVFDGSTCTGYVNGVSALSTSAPDVSYLPFESLIIGSNSDDQFLNSTIENFKIYHSALTASQIASIGGAE